MGCSMKKEFWRKSHQCSDCIYHSPQGLRQDSIDHATVWKEACRFNGYSFWPELKESEICFDYVSVRSNTEKKNMTRIDRWAHQHLCSQCAFYGMNGYDLCDKKIIRNPEEWHAQHRCHGYVHEKDADKSGFCSSYLSLTQWAVVETTPIQGMERGRIWEEFKEQNSGGGEVAEKD